MRFYQVYRTTQKDGDRRMFWIIATPSQVTLEKLTDMLVRDQLVRVDMVITENNSDKTRYYVKGTKPIAIALSAVNHIIEIENVVVK